ncbi:hypothetical protein H257_02516 [Aphanomyces astaci]|uniref:Transposase Tc1-like domain-containing protein n=1 Tax=Aphanomyces astaci TaxID=112090 RepID=W4H4G7_APHAT|nr:hypothetical protein H257_02516 [Aphanomyces astaci]ETV86028.1 hypothetical protein H257_02516 [Aphanomyces astaci]|eukprot:XP_009824500.1 hypothetical protein H257_02516 [Aphanomyces astaci]
MSPAPRSTRELTPGMKMEVVFALQDAIHNGKLARGFIQATAIRCQVGRTTVRKLWRDFMSGSMASKKKGRVGPKPRHTSAEVTEIVRSVPSRDRSTMRDIASSTGISVSTLCCHLKSGTINRRSSRLKPLLTDTNNFEWLAFCRAHVNIQFDAMNAYLSSCGRDAVDAFEFHEPAEYPGRAEFHFSDMWDVTYRDYVVNKVVPSIKERFPSRTKRVVLQHDNATPHGSIDEGTMTAVSTDGWTFVMVSRSMDDVIEATLSAFEVLSSDKLSSIFLTLQAVMRLVMEHHGDKNFKLPHLKKDTLRRAGTLMANVTCPASLLFHVNSILQQSSP